MTRTIESDGCTRHKIVCERIYYKELEPRKIVTLCQSVPITNETQRDSVIKNNNKQRLIN